MQLSDVLNLPEKTWTQKGNGVNAIINTPIHKAKQGQYNWKQPVNITDLTGKTMDITFETEYPESLLNQAHIGKRAIWRLKWWRGRRGQSISGYVESQLNEAGQPEKWQLPSALQTPPQPQQGVQPPAQATKAPQGNQSPNQDRKEPDWDAKDLRMARMNALTNATKLVCLIAESNKEYIDNAEQDPTLLTLIRKRAEILVHYIYNGLTKKQAPQTEKCNQCGAEDITQCSCTPW